MNNANAITIGVISDTHGYLDPLALRALEGSDYIIHAGDVECVATITTLNNIAPVTAVKGNMDRSAKGGSGLKGTNVLCTPVADFYILHDLYALDIDPKAAQMRGVIYGHTHVPSIEWKFDVLYLNPGSASRPRQGHPPSVAKIEILNGRIKAEIITF